MTNRLPDYYYTDKMLDGVNRQLYPKQLGLSYNQGEDAIFTTYLNLNGKPLNVDKYTLIVFVKKNDWAENLIWRGTLHNGIFPVENTPGYFKVWMPNLVTRHLLPGSYHFGFKVFEKLGADGDVWDKQLSLREDYIQILRSADMPNAVQDLTQEIVTKYNTKSGGWEYVSQMVESTVPTSVPVFNGDFGGSGECPSPADSMGNPIIIGETGDSQILISE